MTWRRHYLNQCWNIVNWTLRNKLHWKFNRNANIFIHENAIGSVVCEMATISSRPQCVNYRCRCVWIHNLYWLWGHGSQSVCILWGRYVQEGMCFLKSIRISFTYRADAANNCLLMLADKYVNHKLHTPQRYSESKRLYQPECLKLVCQAHLNIDMAFTGACAIYS